MYLVYLAGPVYRMSWAEISGWRQQAHDAFMPHGIHVLSPVRNKSYHIGKEWVEDASPTETRPLSTPAGIVCRDFNDVRRCDVVLANFLNAKRPSIGTCMELGAAHVLAKPIVTVLDDGNDHFHSMITEVSQFIVPTVDEALEIVKAILLPGV